MINTSASTLAGRDMNESKGGTMLAAVGGVGIVGIVVIVLIVLAVLYFVRRA